VRATGVRVWLAFLLRAAAVVGHWAGSPTEWCHWAADKESACALGRSEESSSAGPPSGQMHRNGFTLFSNFQKQILMQFESNFDANFLCNFIQR
jgi:hypothetical protein